MAITPVVKDINNSCVRRQLADTPEPTFEDDSAALSACDSLHKSEGATLVLLASLTEYMNALQQLAGGQSSEVASAGVDLTNRIASTAGLTTDEAQAARGLVAFSAKVLTNAKNARVIQSSITSMDANVQVVTEALSRIIGGEYQTLLKREARAWRNRYRTAAAEDPSHNPALAVILEDSWRSRFSEVQKRWKAGESANAILLKIRAAHKSLASAGTESLTPDRVVELIRPYTVDIGGLVSDVRKVF